MSRIKVFTDRYPLLGPLIWILTVEYFIIQIIVAAAWHKPSYSWRFNTISDLGNTGCGFAGDRTVCSPLHSLMNFSLICLGVLMAGGSLLIYQEFRKRFTTLVGFSLMAVAGFGTILVGLFPENSVPSLHVLGAALPFVFGNLSLLVLGITLKSVNCMFRIYTFLTGLLAIGALVFFISHHYLHLGIGGIERLVSYPQTVWLILFGLYISGNHYLRRTKKPY